MLLSARKHISDIAGLNRVIAVVFHKGICSVEMPFIVPYGSGGLVMHNHFHAFGLGIITDFLKIEIRVWSHEIEDIVFKMTEPVLPAFVPALNENRVESIIRSKVNVFLHILCSSPVMAMRFDLRIISHSELY